MKVIKPRKLALLQRCVEHHRKNHLVCAVLTYFDLDNTKRLINEQAMWPFIGEEVAGGLIDECFPKPRAEYVVSAKACVPQGQEAGAVVVKARIGGLSKKLAVFGDRHWKGNEPSEPVPFKERAILFDEAFGGPEFERNPLGKGHRPVETEHGPIHFLPNIEDPDDLLTSPKETREPAGFGIYDVAWPQRMSKAGNYGGDWLETLSPGPAVDFDPTFYNGAPDDQQQDAFFLGNEEFEFENLHPAQSRLTGTLSPLRVRVLVVRKKEGPKLLEAFEPRLDTLHFVPHQKRAIAIYRATIPIATDDADDIEICMIAAEDPRAPRAMHHYQRVLEKRLDLDKGALASLSDRDLMPDIAQGWASKPDKSDLEEMTALEFPARARADKARKEKLDETKAQLDALGYDTSAFEEEEPLRPPEDPTDTDAVIEFFDKLDEVSAKKLAEGEADKERLEKERVEKLAATGYEDHPAAIEAMEKAGGPPTFTAEGHIQMLSDLATAARTAGAPAHELEAELADERLRKRLTALEKTLGEGYRKGAHILPRAPIPDAEAQNVLQVRVRAARDAGTSLARADLTGIDLAGQDLSGMDFSEALMECANLTGARLQGTNLSGAVLAKANLRDADLEGADLRGANLGAATLRRTRLKNARLAKVLLFDTTIDETQFDGVELDEVDLFKAKLHRASFARCRAERIYFMQLDLRGVSFHQAELKTCIFLDVDLDEANFSDADLTGCQFLQARAKGADFSRAVLTQSSFVHETVLEDVSFEGAVLTSANLQEAVLKGVNLRGIRADGSNFGKADLEGADLRLASLKGAILIRTNFTNANLEGANMLGCIAQKANLTGANLRDTNISRSDFTRVIVNGNTVLEGALSLDTRVHPKAS